MILLLATITFEKQGKKGGWNCQNHLCNIWDSTHFRWSLLTTTNSTNEFTGGNISPFFGLLKSAKMAII